MTISPGLLTDQFIGSILLRITLVIYFFFSLVVKIDNDLRTCEYSKDDESLNKSLLFQRFYYTDQNLDTAYCICLMSIERS